MKAKWSAEVDLMMGEKTAHATALLKQIKEDLLEQIRPQRFNEDSSNSILFKRSESFERLCYQLRKNSVCTDPSSLTTYSFYISVQLLTDEIEKSNRKHNG